MLKGFTNIAFGLACSLLASCLCASCDTTQEAVGGVSGEALFLTTNVSQGENAPTRSCQQRKLESKGTGSMTAVVEEQEWTEQDTDDKTRAEITGNEITWISSPNLGVYITDATNDNNTLIARNLAINPCNHAFYATYSGSENGTQISTSNFFWDTDWNNKTALPTNVNFYGYYPRPHNGSGLGYERTSIILQEDATGQNGGAWNLLHYFFIDQTDDNMSWHDLMYSIPEGKDIRYGNQNKAKGDNVQMHFAHAFSLLDIEVDKGDTYNGDCVISSLVLSGTQVFTEGTLDILKGNIIPTKGDGNQSVEIKRIFDAKQITAENPFHKTMIVQPTQDGDSPNETGRLTITCCIDGVNYSCEFPTLKLAAGKKYKLKLTLTPAGIVTFKIWHGARVKIGNDEYLPEDSEKEITSKADNFTVTPEDGYKIVDVLKNGVSIFGSPVSHDETDGSYTYELDSNADNNTNYNVVACLKDSWYSTEGLQLHFDGIKNKYNNNANNADCQRSDIGIWYDLSGHNNDGTLRSFTNTSGWDGTGLKFDGLDDVVYFSGKINKSYTMEMYILIEPTQRGAWPRLTAEGPKYPAFYTYGTGQQYDGVRKATAERRSVSFYDTYNSGPGVGIPTDGKTIVQLDFTYNSEEGTLKWYVDGVYKGQRTKDDTLHPVDPESIDIASIGNRYVDNSRALAGTYYSFMIYNRAISADEVLNNYNVNVDRYGSKRK